MSIRGSEPDNHARRNVIVGAALMVLLAIGFVVLVVALLRGLRQEVAAPTIIGALTLLGTAFGSVWAAQHARRRDIEQEHRRQKIAIYEGFMHLLFQGFMKGKPGIKELTPAQFARQSTEFTEKLILWGSDDVVAEWVRLRMEMVTATESQAEVGLETLYRWEEFFFALRRDVGHENEGLREGDLLRLFINDLTPVPAS